MPRPASHLPKLRRGRSCRPRRHGPPCLDRALLPRVLPAAESLTLPILMYHHVTRLQADADALWRGLTVTPEACAEQVKYLAAHGYRTIYFAELIYIVCGI